MYFAKTADMKSKKEGQVALKHSPEFCLKLTYRYLSQQKRNHRLRMDSSLSHRGGGGLNAFYWYQIFALDSAVVEVQELFSSHGGYLLYWRHGFEVIKLFPYSTQLSTKLQLLIKTKTPTKGRSFLL